MKPTAQQCIGTTHEEAWVVGEEQLASHMASGTLPVFATPCMVALMEYTCMKLVEPCLEEGITTVGTVVNIRHVSPTPEGMKVHARATLTETDGRRFVFRVEAYDEAGLIGEGVHERCTVKAVRFMEKVQTKGK